MTIQKDNTDNKELKEAPEGVQNKPTSKEADINNAMLRRMMFNSGIYCMHDCLSVLNKDK